MKDRTRLVTAVFLFLVSAVLLGVAIAGHSPTKDTGCRCFPCECCKECCR